jgi:hypothetical protein
MTKDIKDIVKLAVEIWDTPHWNKPQTERIERFYLAAYAAGGKAEREACAKECEAEANGRSPSLYDALCDCADAIRARGEK